MPVLETCHMNRDQRTVSERIFGLLKTLLKTSSRLSDPTHCNDIMSIYTCWELSLISWRFSISFLLLYGLLLWNTLESTLLSPLLEKPNDLRNRSSGFRVIPNPFCIIDRFLRQVKCCIIFTKNLQRNVLEDVILRAASQILLQNTVISLLSLIEFNWV